MNGGAKSLGVFSLAMISVAAVLSVRNFPSMAIYGWSSIGWYLLGTLLFLLPLTLASAELATGWSKNGGVYAWVEEAWGKKLGFIAVFCEWSNNLVWFPTVLSFIAGTFAYVFNPDLANNGAYMFSVMMIAFWGATAVAELGEAVSSRFNSFGVVVGSIVPCILLVIFGVVFLVQGNPLQVPAFTFQQVVPQINVSTIPFVATIILMFAGMEMAGFHALQVRNPGRDFPRAMAIALAIIFFMSVLGTLALSWVIPVDQLNLASGIMQAFQAFLQVFNLTALTPVIAFLLTLGGLALMISWMVGPVLGLGVVAQDGMMPPIVSRMSRRNVPTGMLVIQGVITTIIASAYIFAPSVNSAYWIMSAWTSLVLCIAYLLIFSSVIRLRITQPDVKRAFKIPGGMTGIYIVGGVGFCATAFAFVVSCLPPEGTGGSMTTLGYIVLMLLGTALLSLPPLIFLRLRKPSWKVARDEPEAALASAAPGKEG